MHPDRETLLAGGRYRLVRRIARGAVASVYEGVAVELGKRVAIKIVDERFLASREVVERFRLEARAASAIESEHIVDVYDVGEDARLGLFMVMELLVGEDVGRRLAREQRLANDVAAAVALQAAWALSKAHAMGVVHRDLKPENLFLVERTVPGVFVKLLDFGIAKLTRRVQADALTAQGSTLGTPQYMSPEQIQAAPDVDHRTDVWALGAVLFEMLAGRPAFEEKATFAETMMQICQERAPRLRDVAPWVPPDLAAIVDDALEPDRHRRLPDAPAFAHRILEAVPDALAPSSLVIAARTVAFASRERLRAASTDRQSGYPDIASETPDDEPEERVFARLGTPSSLRPLDPSELTHAESELTHAESSLPPDQAFARSLGPRRTFPARGSSPPRRASDSILAPLRKPRALAALASAAAAAVAVCVWMIVAGGKAGDRAAAMRTAAAEPRSDARTRIHVPVAPRVARPRAPGGRR